MFVYHLKFITQPQQDATGLDDLLDRLALYAKPMQPYNMITVNITTYTLLYQYPK